jgi:ABC-type branched-subunit amino acid transport system substrate-binding protein
MLTQTGARFGSGPSIREEEGMKRRHPGKLAILLAAVAVAVGLALGASAIASGSSSPSAAHKVTKCPFKNGTINMYMAQDVKAVIGEEIGPAGVRAANVWRDWTNSHGGILGCKFAFTVEDEAFGNDITTCIRDYKNALASGKYDFFVGPTNSACMLNLGAIINAGGKPLMSGIAADHEPFMELFKPTSFHASVSTFLEGRASAVAAKTFGWKKVSLMVPNYAYGQDAGKAFTQYFEKIVPGGKVLTQQEPPFDEKDFSKYINAMLAGKPDGLFTAFFGPFIVPFWQQWKATGNDKNTRIICGLGILATFQVTKSAKDIPANTYCYNRAPYQLLGSTATGKKWSKLYLAKYGKQHPLVSEFAYQIFSSLQMARALIEKTGGADVKKWQKLVESGKFTYMGPYHNGPTYVNPINHMSDSCASVGKIVWKPSVPYHATYNNAWITSCMHSVLTAAEAKKLTNNPGVSSAAIAYYYAHAKAVH